MKYSNYYTNYYHCVVLPICGLNDLMPHSLHRIISVHFTWPADGAMERL